MKSIIKRFLSLLFVAMLTYPLIVTNVSAQETNGAIWLSGRSRYETSVAVANTFFADVDKAVVASGKNFPDGLCGGPLAAAMNAPLILTADGKTEAAADYMKMKEIKSGFVLGGSGALSDTAVKEVFQSQNSDKIEIGKGPDELPII